jgi:hypothetical protein
MVVELTYISILPVKIGTIVFRPDCSALYPCGKQRFIVKEAILQNILDQLACVVE